MFGISCAPELFQKVMESVVAGLKGIIVYIDDIFVHGNTQKEHDERLRDVLDRLPEYGVLLNDKKCVFNVTSLEFVGHTVPHSRTQSPSMAFGQPKAELSQSGVQGTAKRISRKSIFRLKLR